MATRVVERLPYAVVLGAAFMQEHQSTISFGERDGYCPTPDSPEVLFSPLTVQTVTASKDDLALWTIFCAVCPSASGDKHESNFVGTEMPCCLQVADDETLNGVVMILHF